MKAVSIETLDDWRQFVQAQNRFTKYLSDYEKRQPIELADLPDLLPCVCVYRTWLERNEWWIEHLFVYPCSFAAGVT